MYELKKKRNNIKLVFIICISIIFIILCSLSILYYVNNYHSSNNNISNEKTTIEDKSKYTPITHNSKDNDPLYELSILNFTSKREETNLIIRFNLENHLNNDLINKKLIVNYYNGDKKVDSFEYYIKNLKIGSMIEIELGIEINEEVDKYEFVIDKYKTIVNSKEFNN